MEFNSGFKGLNTNQIMKQNLHVKEPGMRVLKHFSGAENL